MSSEDELAARLDEDEALIRRNSDGHGLADGFPDYRTYVDGDTEAADKYIEHFGPGRMRRYVEAARDIIKESRGEGHGWAEHEPAYYAGLDYAIQRLAEVYDEGQAEPG